MFILALLMVYDLKILSYIKISPDLLHCRIRKVSVVFKVNHKSAEHFGLVSGFFRQ